ncbi:MAG: 4Fe-4S dicluster domain-containing protein [Fidelibacterota bacterium]
MPKWGMVIDLNKCTGCGACANACRMENNIPVVGADVAQEGRTMDWMKIITEYEGEYPNVRITHIPRPCFQCSNPPCVVVCPVHATFVNEDGLVGQVYYRCIGCRYCMNACPYTAKSFNYFEPEIPEDYEVLLNPDVTRRMKGVVEKCSFCHHRLALAKDTARYEERELREMDYQTACLESCPTRAIVFGDLDNPEHEVHHLMHSNRAFRLEEDLGAEPKVYYLKREDK